MVDTEIERYGLIADVACIGQLYGHRIRIRYCARIGYLNADFLEIRCRELDVFFLGHGT